MGQIINLKIVFTDATSKMTGINSGAAACLEQELQRPLRRAVCLCHHIEKPFEHLFEMLDGKTLSNTTYSGEVGKKIQVDNIQERPVVNFRPVLNEDLLRTIRKIPEKVSKDFSRDTKWGLGLVECLLTGQTNKWVNSKCGNIHQACWSNREYRILRVYVS